MLVSASYLGKSMVRKVVTEELQDERGGEGHTDKTKMWVERLWGLGKVQRDIR